MSTFPPVSSVDELSALFTKGLLQDSMAELRTTWGRQLAQQMDRVVELRYREAKSRNAALVLGRLAPGVTAAVTAVTGGTLAAQAHGTAAIILGITAAVLGIVGAAFAAWRPNELYAIGVLKAARYERLWWDMYEFGTSDLASAEKTAWHKARDGFTQREEEIASTLVAPHL